MIEVDNELFLERVLNAEQFVKNIETIVLKNNVSHVDAIVHYCDKNNIEVETVAALIKKIPKIKSQLQSDYEELNYLPKSAKLPL